MCLQVVAITLIGWSHRQCNMHIGLSWKEQHTWLQVVYTNQQEFPYPHAVYVFHVQKWLLILACVSKTLIYKGDEKTRLKCY